MNVPHPSPQPTKFVKCPFCGGRPLTKTHIWPKWLNQVWPSDPNFTQRDFVKRPSGFRTVFIQKHKRGFFTQQPHIVCGGCNKGWMKNFEDEVSKFVKPILLGKFHGSLSIVQERALTGWLTLIMILLELHAFCKKTITHRELQHFMKSRAPLENWIIFLAQAQGPKWNTFYVYHQFAIYSLPISDFPMTADGHPVYNSQTTTLGVGKIFATILICPDKATTQQFVIEMTKLGLIQFWPTSIFIGHRPKFPLPIVPDMAADMIANWLRNRMSY